MVKYPDSIEEYINGLDDTTRRQIMPDYDYYEEHTILGASVLRTHTELLMKKHGTTTNIPLWFEMMASATFRYYARKYWQE